MTTGISWDPKSVLGEVVRRSPLPIGLVDLGHLRVVSASPSAAAVLGRTDIEHLDLLEALADADDARGAIALLRNGSIDGYEAHRVFVGPGGTEHAVIVWMRGLARRGFRDWALAVVKPTDDADIRWEGTADGLAPPAILAVGAGDLGGAFEPLGPEIEALLGIRTSSFGDEPLHSWVHPSDADRFTSALHQSQSTGAPQVVGVRLRTGQGAWEPVRVVLKVRAATSGSRLGVAVLPGDDPDRAEVTDTTVAALSREIGALDLVDALTYLPGRAALPELEEDLTEREWEIVARLLRGDRVPAIAGALYLAPSTVRNHLVSVFRKVGVHSQQALISHIRGKVDK